MPITLDLCSVLSSYHSISASRSFVYFTMWSLIFDVVRCGVYTSCTARRVYAVQYTRRVYAVQYTRRVYAVQCTRRVYAVQCTRRGTRCSIHDVVRSDNDVDTSWNVLPRRAEHETLSCCISRTSSLTTRLDWTGQTRDYRHRQYSLATEHQQSTDDTHCTN